MGAFDTMFLKNEINFIKETSCLEMVTVVMYFNYELLDVIESNSYM